MRSNALRPLRVLYSQTISSSLQPAASGLAQHNPSLTLGTLTASAAAAFSSAAAQASHDAMGNTRWVFAAAAAAAATAASLGYVTGMTSPTAASCNPATSPSDQSAVDLQIAEQLRSWLQQQGADISKVEIRRSEVGLHASPLHLHAFPTWRPIGAPAWREAYDPMGLKQYP